MRDQIIKIQASLPKKAPTQGSGIRAFHAAISAAYTAESAISAGQKASAHTMMGTIAREMQEASRHEDVRAMPALKEMQALFGQLAAAYKAL